MYDRRELLMPLADIAGEDDDSTAYDEADIHKLIVGLRGVDSVSHAGVFINRSENRIHGFSVIIDGGFEFGFRGSRRLRGDGSVHYILAAIHGPRSIYGWHSVPKP